MTDSRSLAETIRDALKLYMVVHEGLDEGKELVFEYESESGKKVERLKIVF
jgi:hypothetical protein